MENPVEIYLIVGLGNPGKEYEKTRHNMGFLIVEACARKWGLSFKNSRELKGAYARGMVEEKQVVLLLPKTYVNLSGESVKKAVDHFSIAIPHLLVLVDDVAIPFGEFRMKKGSGSGGHKGLKNIEMQLNSNEYCRLRIGIGNRKEGSLENYVLSPFSLEEAEILPKIVKEAVELTELWLKRGINIAANRANRSRK